MWKLLLGIFVILTLLCGGSGYFLTSTEKGKALVAQFAPQEKIVEVRLEPLERGDLVRLVSAPGIIEPKTKVRISAQVSAKIIALPFQAGAAVKKGDVLVRLDADEYLAALESARANLRGEEARLEGMKADLAESRAERDRVRELFDTKDVSQAELDSAEARFLRAEANVKAAEHGIESAKFNIVRAQKNLDLTTITSPMDGTVTKLNSEVGEQVLGTFNNEGSLIMEIADLRVMLVKARIDESNIEPVKPGQRARVFINAYPDRPFTGTVDKVQLHRQLDRDGTGYVEAEILLELPEGEVLRTGLNANVEVEVETFTDVLKLPSQAVLDRRVDELPKDLVQSNSLVNKDKVFARVVYMIKDGKAVPVPVDIGSSDLTHTIIVAGLNEGDSVITGPYKVLVELKKDQKVAEEGTLKDDKTKEKDSVAASETGNGKT